MAIEDGRRSGSAIDPEHLRICLQVLDQLHEVAEDHPDYLQVRRATAKMFKAVKKQRRLEIRAAVVGRRPGRGGGDRNRLAEPDRR